MLLRTTGGAFFSDGSISYAPDYVEAVSPWEFVILQVAAGTPLRVSAPRETAEGKIVSQV